MGLGREWKEKVDEKSLLEEEQKVEKKFRLKLSPKMIKFKSLNRSEDFLKILKKKKLNTKYYTIYFDKNSKNVNKYLNITFVMKKKNWKCCNKK